MKNSSNTFPPPTETQHRAHVSSMEQYRSMYQRSLEDPEDFWSEIADGFYWERRWDECPDRPFHDYNFDLDAGPIHVSWFGGARTNVCYNALDRHVAFGSGRRVAFIAEPNDPVPSGEVRRLTYEQVLAEVCRVSNWLRSEGVRKGDAVTIYMPQIPELPIAMLACARIGAVHSVVFGGFSAESLAGRICDSRSAVVITATGSRRSSKVVELKKIVDEALEIAEHEEEVRVRRVLVYEQACAITRAEECMCHFDPRRDVWWQDAIPEQSSECPVEWMEAEDPLFMLYTSGSTGKPKGVVHTTAGFMVGAATTFKYIFDFSGADIYFCTADCGWITGHTYGAWVLFVDCDPRTQNKQPLRGGAFAGLGTACDDSTFFS